MNCKFQKLDQQKKKLDCSNEQASPQCIALWGVLIHTHSSFPQLALEHWNDMLQFSTNNSLCMDNLFED